MRWFSSCIFANYLFLDSLPMSWLKITLPLIVYNLVVALFTRWTGISYVHPWTIFIFAEILLCALLTCWPWFLTVISYLKRLFSKRFFSFSLPAANRPMQLQMNDAPLFIWTVATKSYWNISHAQHNPFYIHWHIAIFAFLQIKQEELQWFSNPQTVYSIRKLTEL